MPNHWIRTQWKTMDLLSPEGSKWDYGHLCRNYALFKYKCLSPLMGNNVYSMICEIPKDRLDISSFLSSISMHLALSLHHWDKEKKDKIFSPENASQLLLVLKYWLKMRKENLFNFMHWFRAWKKHNLLYVSLCECSGGVANQWLSSLADIPPSYLASQSFI